MTYTYYLPGQSWPTPFRFTWQRRCAYFEKAWLALDSITGTRHIESASPLYWLVRRLFEASRGGDPAYTILHGWDPGDMAKNTLTQQVGVI